MSHTPNASTPAPAGNVQSTSQAAVKPSLAGVRVRQRKGQAKATAKFEPETFRDALLLHLSLIPSPPTVDSAVAKLVQAGATLELLKYSEQLFELLFVGGLLQPGGSYLDDKRSPIYVLQDAAEGWDPVRGMVETLKLVMQRYKYLQKPLEENFLPDILGYLSKWDDASKDKLAQAVALLVLDVQVSSRCLASLTKDHVVKDNVGLSFFTSFAKAYLSKQSVEHLGATLRRSGLRDIALLFPIQIRDKKHIEDHFKQAGLPQVVEWYGKMALAETKDETISSIERMLGDEESNEQIIEQLNAQQAEKPVPASDLTDWIWQGLVRTVDFSAKAEQAEQFLVQLITSRAPIIEAFVKGAKAEVGLINAVQVYCYADTRMLKAFPQIIKVLYNTDCISDQAIIYWHQKGAKPQGKQHFLKVTEALVKFLEEQDSDEE
ncbi:hypothetical protein JCM24511_02877 [Saitozyma sp. JCM 24511]|nr:hypothetical protein JCM24511_02877 [Saitozyma sp. JCM 24511]